MLFADDKVLIDEKKNTSDIKLHLWWKWLNKDKVYGILEYKLCEMEMKV